MGVGWVRILTNCVCGVWLGNGERDIALRRGGKVEVRCGKK